MSAQSFARNFMGFVFPLFTTQMCKRSQTRGSLLADLPADNNLGYSWAGFLFAAIAFLLAVIREQLPFLTTPARL